MNTLLILVILVIAAVFAFKANILLGIAVIIAGIAGFIWYNYATLLTTQATMQFQNKNYDKALELYEKAYKCKNRKYTVDISYALALVRTGNPDEGLEILNNILSKNLTGQIKKNAKEVRSLVNYRLGNIDDAYEECYELYFEMGHTTSQMRSLMGLLMLIKNGATDETNSFCEEAYDYDSDNRDIADNLAVCCYSRGAYERGLEIAEKIVEENPQFIEGWYHGAQILEAMGDKARALEFAGKIAECNRTQLTTVSEAEVEELIKRLS